MYDPNSPWSREECTAEGFRGEHYFLSNMFEAPCEHGGLIFPSSEHLYQWLKVKEEATWWRQKILEAPDGKIAKALANNQKCPTCIPSGMARGYFLLGIMETALRAKFRDEQLRNLLLATDSLILVEFNCWKDVFWGWARGLGGENHLGRLLMKLRQEFRLQHKN